jgi:hypothetical protein
MVRRLGGWIRLVFDREQVSAPEPALFPLAPALTIIPHRGETMAYRSLTVLLAALLLVLAIVVFLTALGDYLFQPTPVY